MKIKNLYLGIKDQMPLSRFIRNLRKGHVLGLFSKRSHFTAQGKPKVSYGSKSTAIKSAQKMMDKNGCYYSNYKCIYCDGYHLGRNRDNKEVINEN
jgi:hypothetical protein